ncbi:MAG: zinc-binding dehydrogenase [Steroidobacteraceae bacterium]|nr:zinc-binding dehydrogenase [Nevskiaceae bacterium]MCP5471073.1 zinc-binding dehydrogenase [Nevskiaceae bacterium]
MTIPNSQQQYQLVRREKGFNLQLREGAPIRRPGSREALVRIQASSLNRRDLSIRDGSYPIANRDTLVPLSDGAGEVVAVGPETTRFQIGDRVAATFFQSWLAGHPTARTGASALGGALDGMLAQSLAALALGGHIALVGGLSGYGSEIAVAGLIGRNAGITGISVGSRAEFEALNAFLTEHAIRPVIDRVFPFEQADEAYAWMATGNHFGRIVIRL